MAQKPLFQSQKWYLETCDENKHVRFSKFYEIKMKNQSNTFLINLFDEKNYEQP
jgi:hypothetical protein